MSEAAGAGFAGALEEILSSRVILFGGKGGVGKSTLSVLAALHASSTRKVLIFSSDPASNLNDILGDAQSNITIEQLDASALYQKFLAENLPSILELTDRGTYLEKDEARRFFELALPGVDELMAWRHIGHLAQKNRDALVIVDTAPTGHTLRMLSSSRHFEQMLYAFEAMQRKHKDLIQQFARRTVRDELDTFIEKFERDTDALLALLRDPAQTSFIAVTVAEPLITEQTRRLVDAVRSEGISVPFTVLNRTTGNCDCRRCRDRANAEKEATSALAPDRVIAAGRSCAPLDSASAMRQFLSGAPGVEASNQARDDFQPTPLLVGKELKILFFAGKGGVGKTTVAASVALQTARANPDSNYVIISVDPAHALPHLLNADLPSNLAVETIDTRATWMRLRETIGSEIQRVFDALTPRGLSIAHDAEVLAQLVDVAPPGADEIFSIMRLARLTADDQLATIFVDTAPTGHFLRLMDLPESAGEWVHEFMRLLLRYRQVAPPGALGEELLDASRALAAIRALTRSERAAAVVVTRPERIVTEETLRLRQALVERSIAIAGMVANYVTPANDCRCDAVARRNEAAELRRLGAITLVERRDEPPSSIDDLRELVPLVHTPDQ